MVVVLAVMNLIDALMCAAVYPVAFAMWYTPSVYNKLRVNATGTKSIDAIGVPLNEPNLMLAFYTDVASSLLIMLEFIQLCQLCQNTDLGAGNVIKWFRSYFGFLFLHFGRALYLAFIATLVVAGAINQDEKGQLNFSAMNFGIGLFTLANAIANMYLICVHPGFKAGKGAMGAFRPGTRKKDMTEEEREQYIRKFLDNNPGVVDDLNSDEPQLTDTYAESSKSASSSSHPQSTRSKPSLSVGTVHTEVDPFADPFQEPAEPSASAAADNSEAMADSADIVPVLYDFEADPADPEQISVKAGERLVLVLKQDDGWAQVTRLGENTICIVPANYIGEC